MKRQQTQALRLTCAAAAAVFLFFLIELTPHRVHHMFENAENTCVAFTLSKGCALSAPSAPYVATFTFTLQLFPAFTKVWISYLSPSPFRKRAPPAL